LIEPDGSRLTRPPSSSTAIRNFFAAGSGEFAVQRLQLIDRFDVAAEEDGPGDGILFQKGSQ
jgi:hypothetical protein